MFVRWSILASPLPRDKSLSSSTVSGASGRAYIQPARMRIEIAHREAIDPGKTGRRVVVFRVTVETRVRVTLRRVKRVY